MFRDGMTARTSRAAGDTTRLTEVLADMVADASGGEVTSGQVLTTRCPLPVLGISPGAQVRLIDAIAEAFGVGIEPDSDVFYLGDIRVLADYLVKRGAQPPPALLNGHN